MEERTGVKPPTNIGISLLLVVFLVLCLFTFSAIALVQAGNESEYAKVTAKSRTAYYEALNEAESRLHELNVSAASGAPDLSEKVDASFPVGEEKNLEVSYVLHRETAPAFYEMQKCRIASTGKWEGDDTVNIIQ